jgi:4a-hydroxytetrahydrobiopterin dehydratase
MPRLTEDELRDVPRQLRGWAVVADALEKRFRFSTFADAIAFVNRVADVAEDIEHYPQVEIGNGSVVLRLLTPTEGGVTERDVYLAHRIDTRLGR